MGFIFILETNTLLVGRYWDFKTWILKSLKLAHDESAGHTILNFNRKETIV